MHQEAYFIGTLSPHQKVALGCFRTLSGFSVATRRLEYPGTVPRLARGTRRDQTSRSAEKEATFVEACSEPQPNPAPKLTLRSPLASLDNTGLALQAVSRHRMPPGLGCWPWLCGSMGLMGLDDLRQTTEDKTHDLQSKKSMTKDWVEERKEDPLQRQEGNGPDKVRRVGSYELGRTLGSGMSGKVKLGTHAWSGRIVALKIVDRKAARKSLILALKKEIKAMRALKHPNIIRLEFVETSLQYPRKYGGFKDVLVLGLEYAEGGALCEYMVDQGAFKPSVVRTLFHQIVDALAFCHARGIYHRDVKPSNILVDKSFRIKVADFGLAALREEQGATLMTNCGTLAYMAPELHAKKPYNGAKADVWSVGVVLFNLCTFAAPFNSARKGDWYFDRICQSKWDNYWKAVGRSFPGIETGTRDLIEKCLSFDPATRYTMEQILKHPWMVKGGGGGGVEKDAEVAAELTKRKEVTRVKKVKEKEKALRRRPHVSGIIEYDPFDRKISRGDISIPADKEEVVVMREETTHMTATSEAGSPLMKAESSSIAGGPFDLFSYLGGAETLQDVNQALCRMGALVETRRTRATSSACSVVLRVSLPVAEEMKISAKVEVVECAGPVTLIKIKSPGASIIEVNELLYKPLKEELKGVIPDADGGGEKARVEEKEEKEEGVGEPLDGEGMALPLLRGGSSNKSESILADGDASTGMI